MLHVLGRRFLRLATRRAETVFLFVGVCFFLILDKCAWALILFFENGYQTH
jgi:hypothetical protein